MNLTSGVNVVDTPRVVIDPSFGRSLATRTLCTGLKINQQGSNQNGPLRSGVSVVDTPRVVIDPSFGRSLAAWRDKVLHPSSVYLAPRSTLVLEGSLEKVLVGVASPVQKRFKFSYDLLSCAQI